MPLFFQTLASGSKGNAILICSQKTRMLLDAGLSAKELVSRLQQTGVKANQLDAVVISHEHSDHVRGLGTLSRRFDLPVYLTQGTLDNLPPEIGQLADVRLFQPGNPFAIGDLKIKPFAVSHDARDPAGFVLEHDAQAGCLHGPRDCDSARQDSPSRVSWFDSGSQSRPRSSLQRPLPVAFETAHPQPPRTSFQ